MKIYVLLLLSLSIGLSGYSQLERKFGASLWIISDSKIDLSDLNYFLYSGDSLISNIKNDSLTISQERPQKYELRVTSKELTLIVTQLIEVPIVLTNIEVNKRKITWVDIAKLDKVAREKDNPDNLELVLVDYALIKPTVHR